MAIADSPEQAERIKTWVVRVLCIAVAVLIALVIVNATVIDNIRGACAASGNRANFDAQNWEQASKVRRASGDIETADIYANNVINVRKLIFMPDDWKGKPIERGTNPEDVKAGCDEAIVGPLPFIR